MISKIYIGFAAFPLVSFHCKASVQFCTEAFLEEYIEPANQQNPVDTK